MKNKAHYELKFEEIARKLNLPKNVSLHRVDVVGDTVIFSLRGPNLPEVHEGEVIPRLRWEEIAYPKQIALERAGWKHSEYGDGHIPSWADHAFYVKPGHEKIPTEWIEQHTVAELRERMNAKAA